MRESQSLPELLRQEIDVIKELNAQSLLKKEALLKDDLDALQVIVLKEEALSQKLKKIDDACSPQVQFFLRGESSVNKHRLNNQHDNIAVLIEELRRQTRHLKLNNDFNQALIKDALALVDFTINALLPQNRAEQGFYEASGKVAKDKKTSKKTMVLDYKG